jgi:uncharacterized membrane protein
MKIKFDKMLILTTVICILPIIMSLMVFDRLPDQVPVHWNFKGEVDNYASKQFGAFGLPLLMAFINFIVHMGLNNDPKKANYSVVLKQFSMWLIPVMTLFLVPITLLIAMGYDIKINVIIPIFVGIIIIICGNYLPKCKQNYTMGIKLPWTLNSEENWNKTHHLAGFIWTIGGILLVLTTFLNVNSLPLLLTIIFSMVVVPAIYSYMLYKKGI